MTREQARKFLTNTKVYVGGKSREIQTKLFSLGFGWCVEHQKIHNTDKPFLFIYEDNSKLFIIYSTNVEWFSNHPSKEITAEDILNITIDEPTYRPFKDAEECLNEMLKHHPFGWLRFDDMYINIICVHSVDKMIELSPETLKFEDSAPVNIKRMFISMECAFNEYLFADGTPFGIKED